MEPIEQPKWVNEGDPMTAHIEEQVLTVKLLVSRTNELTKLFEELRESFNKITEMLNETIKPNGR